MSDYELTRDCYGRLISIHQTIAIKPSHWKSHRVDHKLIWHVARGNGQLTRQARIVLMGEGYANPEAELLTYRERNPVTVDCSGVDPSKRTSVPMFNKITGAHEFNLTLFGVTAEDLMTVPNPVIGSLAARYPEHQSNLFLVETL